MIVHQSLPLDPSSYAIMHCLMKSLLLVALINAAFAADPMVTMAVDPAKAAQGLRLIKTSDDVPARWVTERQINALYRDHIKFFDMTFTGDSIPRPFESQLAPAIPSEPSQQAIVNPIIAAANTQLMTETLKKLTDFNNRYYRSETGVADSHKLANF